MGTLRVTRSVLAHIRRVKGRRKCVEKSQVTTGRVITITSGIARSYYPVERSAYCMPKAALEALQDCLRLEMRRFDVKVSVLARRTSEKYLSLQVITVAPGGFASNTRIFDVMLKQVDSWMEKIPARVREEYTEEYLSAFREQWTSGKGKYNRTPSDSRI